MSILGLSGGGEAGSYIRFMPSANAWMKGSDEIPLTQVILDHDSVRTGWGKMAEGQAPEWIWDAQLGVRGQQPSPDHKRGFSVRLYTKTLGVLEWSSTGTGPCIGFDRIFTSIWEAKDDNRGKVPVLRYTGSSPMKVGKGNTRVPEFTIEKWVDRPDALDQGSNPAPPAPAPAPKPAAATPPKHAAGADEF